MMTQRTYDDLTADPVDLATLEERWKRAAADLANYRKRAERDLTQQRQQEREAVLRDWLPVVDNIERALVHQDNLTLDTLLAGLQAMHQQAKSILDQYGVRRMHTVDTLFNPEEHEAIACAPGVQEGVILDEVTPGYQVGEATLRPAQVIVATVTEEGRNGI
ncbi:MAG: nucleotide exchange factor GrpE [Candidatus Tectomicrobia bacterium]|nr:nucleotide exchange factor GrpE [Candidatus Tectomicrobia bacterium]